MADNENTAKENLIYTEPDSLRQFQETENLKEARLKEQVAFETGNRLLALLASLKCDASVIASQALNLTSTDKGYDGSIAYTIGTMHNGEPKVMNVPIAFKAGQAALPESSILEAILTSTKGSRTHLMEEIKKEIEARLTPIAPKAGVAKKASCVTSPGTVLAPVIDVDKTWLPGDIKVGDLLFVDGAKYRVTSGDRRKLSAESDGSFWTLQLVMETIDSKEKPTHIIY